MTPRFCICLPTFNNPGTIRAMVENCLKETTHPILVVDDGSDTPVDTLLQTDPRVTVLRAEKNEGKGKRLRDAFEWAVRRGYTHLITLDSDGQHMASDIELLAAQAKQNPQSLIIGVRKFSSPNIPKISVFGRTFSNFWVKYETNFLVSDSQSGFRIYPLFFVQNMKFFCKRYDFEIEVLIRLIWKQVAIHEVTIDVFYPPAEERVSHFRGFVDNARISFLNAVLVTMSLFRLNRPSTNLAVSLGIGIAIGCTPFFGFHTLIAIVASLLFRLNLLVVFLGTQVSIPPLAPILIAGSINVGKLFSDAFWYRWLIGSLFLGTILGALGGLLFLFIHRSFFEKRAKNWDGKSRGGRFGNWFMRTVIRVFGLRAGYFVLYFVVPYFYLFAPRARRASHEYWRMLYPETSFAHRLRLVFTHLLQFGKVLLDRAYQSYSTQPVFEAHATGIDNISRPINAKEPVLILGAHVGGWDIASRFLEWGGVNNPFHPVQLEASGVTFEKNLRKGETTSVQKVFTNYSAFPIFEIRSILEQGKPIGMMTDRPVTESYELVPFFGKLAAFDTTAFRLAATLGVPVVISFGFKSKEPGKYEFFASDPQIYQYSANRAQDLYRWSIEFAETLERYVRQFPTQWFNFFPFWSATPQLATPQGSD